MKDFTYLFCVFRKIEECLKRIKDNSVKYKLIMGYAKILTTGDSEFIILFKFCKFWVNPQVIEDITFYVNFSLEDAYFLIPCSFQNNFSLSCVFCK